MTDQQRDTDFAHVRVGTVVAATRPSYPDLIPAGVAFPVEKVEEDGVDERYIIVRAAPLNSICLYEDEWIDQGFYIISQPDEAPEEEVAASFSGTFSKEELLAAFHRTKPAPALDEAAIRDKALEDAALRCDEKAKVCREAYQHFFSDSWIFEAQAAEELAAAIRQMKGGEHASD